MRPASQCARRKQPLQGRGAMPEHVVEERERDPRHRVELRSGLRVRRQMLGADEQELELHAGIGAVVLLGVAPAG